MVMQTQDHTAVHNGGSSSWFKSGRYERAYKLAQRSTNELTTLRASVLRAGEVKGAR